MDMPVAVGTAIGILGIVIGAVIAVWLWMHPRRGVLALEARVVPVTIPESEDVAVSYKGKSLDNPHICTIRMKNVGSTEVNYQARPEEHFYLTVKVPETDGPLYVLETPPRQEEADEVTGAGIRLRVPSFLLNQGETMEWSILSAGRPSPAHSEKIVGVKVIEGPAANQKPSKGQFLAVLLGGVGYLLLGFWVLGGGSGLVGVAALLFGGGAVLLGVAGLALDVALLAVSRSRKNARIAGIKSAKRR